MRLPTVGSAVNQWNLEIEKNNTLPVRLQMMFAFSLDNLVFALLGSTVTRIVRCESTRAIVPALGYMHSRAEHTHIGTHYSLAYTVQCNEWPWFDGLRSIFHLSSRSTRLYRCAVNASVCVCACLWFLYLYCCCFRWWCDWIYFTIIFFHCSMIVRGQRSKNMNKLFSFLPFQHRPNLQRNKRQHI